MTKSYEDESLSLLDMGTIYNEILHIIGSSILLLITQKRHVQKVLIYVGETMCLYICFAETSPGNSNSNQ